jgi:hypothetical protein
MSKKQTHLVAKEAPGDVDLLAPDDDDFLPRENLFGDNGGQPTKEMTLAINDDGCRGECGHGEVWNRRRVWVS